MNGGDQYDTKQIGCYPHTTKGKIRDRLITLVMFADPGGQFASIQSTASAIAITSILVSLALPNSANNVFEGYVSDFSLQFFKGIGYGEILYGGFLNAKITSFAKDRRHAYQAGYIVYLFGAGFGGGINIASDKMDFTTYKKTSLYDFGGIGRISTMEYGIPEIILRMSAITLPNGSYIEPDPGFSKGIGWEGSIYCVITYWKLNQQPQKIW